MIELKLRSGKHERANLARSIAAIVQGREYDEGPYMPNDRDDHWSIDLNGNDWWLSFFDDPTIIRITYRYQSTDNQAEEALAAWLCFTLHAEILPKCQCSNS